MHQGTQSVACIYRSLSDSCGTPAWLDGYRKPDLTGKTLKQEGNNLCLLLEQTQVLTCFLDILIKS